jgi:hypothetical protein
VNVKKVQLMRRRILAPLFLRNSRAFITRHTLIKALSRKDQRTLTMAVLFAKRITVQICVVAI